MPLETIYLYILIISGALTILYLFFGDILSGAMEGIPFINPTLIFSFLTVYTAGGYLMEILTPLHSGMIAAISAVAAFIFVSILNIFVLIPLSTAEESLVYKESDLKGRVGTVITSIPEDGFGEVILESISGRIAKPAASFDKVEIPYGKKVLVIDVVNGVLHVAMHDELENYI